MKIMLDHTETINQAGTAQTFWFKPERPLRYQAGQYVEMLLPHAHADKRGLKRWFTLSSSPSEELISITTKLDTDNSTFKRALRALEPGAEVQISEPMGDFVLPRDQTIPLVFVAGGIGITPVRSMVQWMHDTDEHHSALLLYAVRHPAELAYEQLLATTSYVTFRPIISQPSAGWSGAYGPLTAAMILDCLPEENPPLVYLSGPEPMIENLEKDLRRGGLPRSQIVLDFFPGYLN